MVFEMDNRPRYAEFFCGGGMVRAALDSNWHCAFANDIDPMKCRVYRDNWSGKDLIEGDITTLNAGLLQQPIDLYWASSPCQDFSLAGKGLGLGGARSGVFNLWLDKIRLGIQAGYAPRIISFENVIGLISRQGGRDFDHVVRSFISLGYNVGALEVDACHFVPQSRPRLFVIAVRRDLNCSEVCSDNPTSMFVSSRLARFHAQADAFIKASWLWFRLPNPLARPKSLLSLIDCDPDTPWLSDKQVGNLVSMMSAPSLARIEVAKAMDQMVVGTLYKRGRPDASGRIRQRAEVRFDGIAGCLRTPAGGSSRQTLVVVKNEEVRARLLSRHEAARLMGLPASYRMPERYNDAYKVAGDGVVVPIVRHLDEHLFQPLIRKHVANREVA